jgi:hypothetical protein
MAYEPPPPLSSCGGATFAIGGAQRLKKKKKKSPIHRTPKIKKLKKKILFTYGFDYYFFCHKQ